MFDIDQFFEGRLLFFVLHVFSVAGIFLFTMRLVQGCLSPVIGQLERQPGVSSVLFLASIAWLTGLSIRAIVGLYVFIGGLTSGVAIGITTAVAIGGLWVFRLPKKCDTQFWRQIKTMPNAEWAFFAPICLVLLCFGTMIFVPTDAWDSSVKYVTNAKYIANGWNAHNLRDALLLGREVTHHLGPLMTTADKILEISDAQSIRGIGDTQFVLFLRWLNIVAMAMAVYGFLRLVTVQARWAALTTAGVLLSPDLTRLGVSGKLDGTIAAIEIGAATLLMLAWYVRYKLKSGNYYLLLVMLAFVLSLFSAAGRLSGMYLVSITGLSLLFLVLSANITLGKKFLILSGSCLVFGLFSALYIFMFPTGFYPPQQLTLDQLRWYFSIEQFPIVLNELYLIVHLALGLEDLTQKFQWLKFLPHARHHGISMFMLSPLMLSIFLAPLFFRRHKIIAIATILFICWFSIWASSAHFSRLFIAGSSVAVIITGVIASLNRRDVTKGQYALVKVTQLCLVGTVLCFLPWAIYSTAFRNYDYEIPRSLYDNELRHELRLKFLAKHAESAGVSNIAVPLTYAEAREVDKVLSEIELPIVISDRSKSINVLFQNGLFLQDGVTNVADLYPEADCIVGDKAYILLRNEDFQHQFSRKINIGENWLLYCL